MNSNSNYCIHRLYTSNIQSCLYSDAGQEDGWQLEVYLRALGLMTKYHFGSVIDVGCGSAYKLMTYFGSYQTTGIDTAVTCQWLNNKYPDRTWLDSDLGSRPQLKADVVICSDVIEHVTDPDALIAFIKAIDFRYLVLSTPCRDILYPKWHRRCHFGPPTNKTHIREWSFSEFGRYISGHFKVLDHCISNIPQATQLAICSKK